MSDHILGISASKTAPREENDFYATHGETIMPLLMVLGWLRGGKLIWENSCGQGHLSEALRAFGHTVISTDLIDRGYGTCGVDFLKPTIQQHLHKFDGIIMNPPYKHAQEFVRLSLERVRTGGIVAAFFNIRFLEGTTKRRPFLLANPPRYVCVFSKRQKCAINAQWELADRNSICYAWFIWEKGYTGKPEVILI